MKNTPRVPSDRPLMAIVYKYNSTKVPGSIATEGAGITDTDYPYLSRFPNNYHNVSI